MLQLIFLSELSKYGKGTCMYNVYVYVYTCLMHVTWLYTKCHLNLIYSVNFSFCSFVAFFTFLLSLSFSFLLLPYHVKSTWFLFYFQAFISIQKIRGVFFDIQFSTYSFNFSFIITWPYISFDMQKRFDGNSYSHVWKMEYKIWHDYFL